MFLSSFISLKFVIFTSLFTPRLGGRGKKSKIKRKARGVGMPEIPILLIAVIPKH